MIQRGSRLRLALKTRQGVGIARHYLGEKLEGNKTMETCVLGLVDHTHPTDTEFLDDVVVRDGLADHLRKVSPFTRPS